MPVHSRFNLIVAVSENFGIGKNGDLPWNLKNEFKYFQRMTKTVKDPAKQNAIIMGRKTYFSVPDPMRPLKGRLNVVLTRDTSGLKFPENVIVCKSLNEAMAKLNESDISGTVENIWIAGGSAVYKEAMESEFCHRIYLTEVKKSFDCDTFFPKLTEDFKRVKNDDDIPEEIQEENGLQYEFKIYEKVN